MSSGGPAGGPGAFLKGILGIIERMTLRELLLIQLALRLFVIGFPRDGSVVFDEAYYTQAARDLLARIPSNLEHPFLGKLWGAIGMVAFGDHWFGWRIHSVIFGILTLYVFNRLSGLFLGERAALYATALLGFDNIFFSHTSLFLLEGPALFFSILCLYLYFTKRYNYSAVSLGLAILSKETSAFFLFTVILFHLAARYRMGLRGLVSKSAARKALTFLLILVLVFSVPMTIYERTYTPATASVVKLIPTVVVDEKGNFLSTVTMTTTERQSAISDPVQHVIYIVTYASSLTIGPTSKVDQNNYPWNWVLPLPPKEIVYYGLGLSKTVVKRMGETIVSTEVVSTSPIRWVGLGNLPLWILGFWIIFGYLLVQGVRGRLDRVHLYIGLWVATAYGPYLLMTSILGRIAYPFYFINTVPALALGVSVILHGERSETKELLRWVLMAAVLGWFFAYFPVRPQLF